MTYFLLSIVKIFDNIISTAKSIATYKEAKILSSILTIVSQLIFYLVISKIIQDNTLLCIVVVSISSGVGNYIAFTLNEKYKKDEKWTMIITCQDKQIMCNICKMLQERGIKHVANKGLNLQGEDTLHIIAFSNDKNASSYIKECINMQNQKCLLEVI